jgi:F0F1-type ATP synthase assembly protein I
MSDNIFDWDDDEEKQDVTPPMTPHESRHEAPPVEPPLPVVTSTEPVEDRPRTIQEDWSAFNDPGDPLEIEPAPFEYSSDPFQPPPPSSEYFPDPFEKPADQDDSRFSAFEPEPPQYGLQTYAGDASAEPDSQYPFGFQPEPFDRGTPHSNYEPDPAGETSRRSGLAFSAGIVFFGAVVFMLFLGWIADLLLGSSPWGLVGGIILGSVIGLIQFVRITSSIFNTDKSEAAMRPLMPHDDDDLPSQ